MTSVGFVLLLNVWVAWVAVICRWDSENVVLTCCTNVNASTISLLT